MSGLGAEVVKVECIVDKMRLLGNPLCLSRTPSAVASRGPVLGAYTKEFPGDRLGSDSIPVETEVTAKKEITSKTERGAVTFLNIVRKQTGDTVMETDKIRMIRRKSANIRAA